MQTHVIAPSARLAPFVARFVIVESEVLATRVLVPEPGLALGVRYRGGSWLVDGDRSTAVPDAAVTGVRTIARTMRTAAGSGVVVAQFRATGAAACFAPPLHALFGATVALDALVPGATARRVLAEVGAARDHAGRVAALEAFLIAQLRPAPPDPIAAAAVRAIDAHRGAIRIAALARALGISQDPLEKRFRRAIGASPKQVASLVRVRHALALQRAGASWARAAHEAGYCDQSHLVRELRAVVGVAPGEFVGATAYC
ncbi:MAG: helix-turn-helix domain-containing protein [Deltaproteobacteria bacterium]|nr:helix-turn-helix domain-containing protein [Deltaproteobacteria bacterium]